MGDHGLKLKQKSRSEIFTPLPDYLLADSAQRAGGYHQQAVAGAETPGFASSVPGMRTVSGLAEARGTVLSLKLDKMSDSVTGQTVVDPRGYLTDLNSLKVNR